MNISNSVAVADALLIATPLHAENMPVSSWWNDFTDDVAQTWNAPQHTDLYLPFIRWYARFMYDKEKTDNYTRIPGAAVWVFPAIATAATGVRFMRWR